MKQYKALMEDIIKNGTSKGDRTGTGTTSVFARQMRFDLTGGKIPMVTGKFTWWKGALQEFIWMVVNGNTNIIELLDNNIRFWSAWPYESYCKEQGNKLTLLEFEAGLLDGSVDPKYGNIGKGYGYQNRRKEYVRNNRVVIYDQVQELIKGLKSNPESRRHIVTLFDPLEQHETLLPPCHHETIWNITDGKLNCEFSMRSNDVFLGLPINLCYYSLYVHVVAKILNLEAGELVYSGTDIHLYDNHAEQVQDYLKQEILPETAYITWNKDLYDIDHFTAEHVSLKAYKYSKRITAPVAV
jgi:thymidylate synthase